MLGLSGGYHKGFANGAATYVRTGDPLAVELGAGSKLFKQLKILNHLATCPGCTDDKLARDGGREDELPFYLHCNNNEGKITDHAFFLCSQLWSFWAYVGEVIACIKSKWSVLLDFAYIVNNMNPLFTWKKQMVFLAILAVARLVIWTTRLDVIHRVGSVSDWDLVAYFKLMLEVKIRCDWKRLHCINFDMR